MKVDFMIIGAMKCGTSTLAKILANHPQVSFSKRKEPHFFSKNPNWKENLEDYHKLFEKEDGVIYGEGSTTYTNAFQFNLLIWEDIYKYNPEMKFIYIVRNPLDRLVSHYVHMYERGYTKYSLSETYKKFPSLIYRGRYFTQIRPYIEKFGKEQVLILDFERLLRHKKQALNNVSEFLKIDPTLFENAESVHVNKAGDYKTNYKLEKIIKFFGKPFSIEFKTKVANYLFRNKKGKLKEKPVLTSKEKIMLKEIYRLELLALEDMTGRNFSRWLI